MFERAIAAARLHKHRSLGPTLADLAEVQCATERTSSGLKSLDEAAQAVARDYPDDAWRFAVFCRAALAALLGLTLTAGIAGPLPAQAAVAAMQPMPAGAGAAAPGAVPGKGKPGSGTPNGFHIRCMNWNASSGENGKLLPEGGVSEPDWVMGRSNEKMQPKTRRAVRQGWLFAIILVHDG